MRTGAVCLMTENEKARRIASLEHSLELSLRIGAAKRSGISKRVAIKQLHFTDIRHSLGDQSAESNPHVDRRRKRTMRIRPEHTGAQRVMRARQRDIFAAETELEQFIALADAAYDLSDASQGDARAE